MRKARMCVVAPLVALGMMLSTAWGQQVAVAPAGTDKPKNVIVMVSDGMGPAAVTLTRLVSGKQALTIDDYLIGTRRTSSSDKLVTDSAAAGTAMATGQLTKNDYVGVTPTGEPLGNVLEAAKVQKKMATGLVVTSPITDATPASFSAHVKTRDNEVGIAAQQLGLGVDVLFGGGQNFYVPTTAGGKRKDGRDLLAEAREAGYQVLATADDLAGNLRLPVIGLFAKEDMHYEIDRAGTKEPSLEAMTRTALQLLSARPEGFFLLVEGSEIDHTEHANDGGALVPEVLAFDAAFAAAIEFAKRDGRTLVVSTSDHDTGGLTINGGDWTTARNGPLRLRANKASAEAMVGMVTKGTALADVLRDYAGITNVTEEEKAAYEAAKAGPPADLTKRRIAAIVKIVNTRASIKWASTDHTAVDVNVYAYGPGQEVFRGAKPATWMATGVAQVLGLDLEEATRVARARIQGEEVKTEP
jgi:alkaline phosphatase